MIFEENWIDNDSFLYEEWENNKEKLQSERNEGETQGLAGGF